jgi:hypothetical protein
MRQERKEEWEDAARVPRGSYYLNFNFLRAISAALPFQK